MTLAIAELNPITDIAYHCVGRTRTDAFGILHAARQIDDNTILFLIPNKNLDEAKSYMQAIRMFVSRLRQQRREQNKEVIRFEMQTLAMSEVTNKESARQIDTLVQFRLKIFDLPKDVKQAFAQLETQ